MVNAATRRARKQAAINKAAKTNAIMSNTSDTFSDTSNASVTTPTNLINNHAIVSSTGSTASTSASNIGITVMPKTNFNSLPLEIKQRVYTRSLPYLPNYSEIDIHDKMQAAFDALAEVSTTIASEIPYVAGQWYEKRLKVMMERLEDENAKRVKNRHHSMSEVTLQVANLFLDLCNEPGRTAFLVDAMRCFIYIIERILGFIRTDTDTKNVAPQFQRAYASYLGSFSRAVECEIGKMCENTNAYRFKKFCI